MSRPKVLFVDDEERIVRLLRMMFRDVYEVFTAVSGAEALELMRQHTMDVLVSDQRMPGITGIELLAESRRIAPETVRILLTGYSDLVAIIGAVNEGEVFRFLNKPWNQDEIKAVLADAVQLAAEAREVAKQHDRNLAAYAPPLAKAVMLLSLDGVDNKRHEMMELFASDLSVITARSLSEAEEILSTVPDIGVMIAECQETDNERVDLLAGFAQLRPSMTIIMLASVIESDMVIKLINKAKIYRFAMKPIQPNVFRLAVAAAMKEHNRRLSLILPNAMPEEALVGRPGMVNSIVNSLSRFTKVW